MWLSPSWALRSLSHRWRSRSRHDLARRPYRRSDAAMLRADLSALEGVSVDAAVERSPSTARPWQTYAACVLAGAIVGAGAVGSLWWGRDRGSSRPSGPPFEATGTVTVFGSWVGGQADEGCVGIDDFADLRPGAPVKVFDLSGNQLAQGQLKGGTAGKAVGNSCTWPIEVNGIPGGATQYALRIGKQAELTKTREELESGLDLSFGSQ